MREESLRRGALEAGLEAGAGQVGMLFEMFMEERDKAITPYSDVREVLDSLHSDGWTIALLTNGNANPAETGIAGYLDVLLYAEETGVRKPRRGAFESVCDATGCGLGDLVHVGDSLEHDIAGARAAGATAVWLNRAGLPRDESIEPHFEIASMTELPGILASLRP